MKLTPDEVQAHRGYALRLMSRARQAVRDADEKLEDGAASLVSATTAFGFGVLQGRSRAITFAGVPVELGMGFVLHGIGLVVASGAVESATNWQTLTRVGLATKYLRAVGDGALTAYMATLGHGVGLTYKDERDSAPAQLPPAAASGHTISDAELARMAQGETRP